MSSISSSHPNPNPNSQSSEPSNSTKSTKSKRKNRNSRRKRNKNKNKNKSKNNQTPNWLELPEDLWFQIFSKLNTIHVIENVQKVCMLFRSICKQPSMFKVVDMTLPDAYMDLSYDVNAMTRFIVDRSCGCLLDIYMEFICNDPTLMYIAERSKNLKHLRIGHYIQISGEKLVEAIKSLPMLEEVEIIICFYSGGTVEAIGHACPLLKSFSFNGVGFKDDDMIYNEEALAIAKSMPNLRILHLIGNSMSNVGLKAILDGCPLLESLDLRACFGIDLSGDLGKRCKKIKHLRLPLDSTADYGHEAVADNEEYDYFAGLDYSDDSSGVVAFDPLHLDFGELDPVELDPDYLEYLECFDDFEHYDMDENGFLDSTSSD